MEEVNKNKKEPEKFSLFTLARYILRGIPKEKVLCFLKQNHSNGVIGQENFEGERDSLRIHHKTK